MVGLPDGGGGDSEAGEDAGDGGDGGDDGDGDGGDGGVGVGAASVCVSRTTSRPASPPLEHHTT